MRSMANTDSAFLAGEAQELDVSDDLTDVHREKTNQLISKQPCRDTGHFLQQPRLKSALLPATQPA